MNDIDNGTEYHEQRTAYSIYRTGNSARRTAHSEQYAATPHSVKCTAYGIWRTASSLQHTPYSAQRTTRARCGVHCVRGVVMAGFDVCGPSDFSLRHTRQIHWWMPASKFYEIFAYFYRRVISRKFVRMCGLVLRVALPSGLLFWHLKICRKCSYFAINY